MKRNSISLRLDNPCTQEWAQMTPSEKGRFCDSCQKHVIDFTQLTDNEILKIIAENKSGFCGQFRISQLDRPFVETKLNGGGAKLNSFVAGLMIAAGAGTLSAQSAPTVPVQTQVIDQKNPTGHVCIKETTQDTTDREFNFIVTDTSGTPLMNAMVFLPGSTHTATSDSAGHIKLMLPYNFVQDSLRLQVQCNGYETEDIYVTSTQTTAPVSISLLPREIYMLGGPMLIYNPPTEDVPNPPQKTKRKQR